MYTNWLGPHCFWWSQSISPKVSASVRDWIVVLQTPPYFSYNHWSHLKRLAFNREYLDNYVDLKLVTMKCLINNNNQWKSLCWFTAWLVPELLLDQRVIRISVICWDKTVSAVESFCCINFKPSGLFPTSPPCPLVSLQLKANLNLTHLNVTLLLQECSNR